MKQPQSPEAVRMILVMEDLRRAYARLKDMERCPAAQVLVLQAAECVRTAYSNEQGAFPT